MDNNCDILDFIQAFSYVENVRLNLVTCMTVAKYYEAPVWLNFTINALVQLHNVTLLFLLWSGMKFWRIKSYSQTFQLIFKSDKSIKYKSSQKSVFPPAIHASHRHGK